MRTITALKISVLLLFVASSYSVNAQIIPDTVRQKIDQLFKQYDTDKSPGAVVAIIRNDSILYSKGYGLANLESQAANNLQSIYYICSLAKQFTAYSVLLLAKEHKLSFDDDIRTYLKWMPDFGKKITIRHLLHHTSGLRDDLALLKIAGVGRDGIITQQTALDILQRQRTLNFLPGEAFSYSNSNYILLAEIVKAVSGQSFRAFTDSAIFTPLHMPHSHFYDPYNEIIEGRASSYTPAGQGVYRNSFQNVYTLGDGGLFMPMEDMERWVMNLFNNKIGDSSDIALLNEKGKLNNGEESANTTALVRDYTAWMYNGGLNGFKTLIVAFPEIKTAFILFANNGDDNMYNLYNPLADLFVSQKKREVSPGSVQSAERKPIANDTAFNQKVSGDYIADNNFHLSFYTDSGRLYFRPEQLLLPIAKDTFSYAANPSAKFVFAINQHAANNSFVNINLPGQMLHLVKYNLDKRYSDPDILPFVGDYYCAELGCRYQIADKNHKLVLLSAIYHESPIDIWDKANLYNDAVFGHLSVLYGTDHRVKGFEVNNGTLSHLTFTRIR